MLAAAYTCIARSGLAKTTVDDVAREAGLSRPTVYRHFPGGKDAILRETVAWEATRFLSTITRAVAGIGDLPGMLEELIVTAGEEVEGHAVLQKVLQTEPERLLPLLVTGISGLIAVLKPLVLLAMQRSQIRADVDADFAADYIARLVLSVVGSPGGIDRADRGAVRSFVDVELLGALL